jgi:hypothetical protein
MSYSLNEGNIRAYPNNRFERNTKNRIIRTGKEIRFRFGSSEDKAGKEAKRRPTGW